MRVLRFACRADASSWRPVLDPPASDAHLARAGWVLAGVPIRVDSLSPVDQRQLLRLAALPAQQLDQEQRRDMARLLAQCPRVAPVPPIDLDFADGAPAGAKLASIMRRLSEATLEVGLGLPHWCWSGGSGLHGDLLIPDHVEHRMLVPAVGELVRAAAGLAEIPLLSDHREKATRPPLVVDDTLYARTIGSRGVIWRLEGAPKPGGAIKRSCGLQTHPARADVILEVAQAWERRAQEETKRLPAVDPVIAEATRGSLVASNIASWDRSPDCPCCGGNRCRVSPDKSHVYCFREGVGSKPGKLISIAPVSVVTFKRADGLPPGRIEQRPDDDPPYIAADPDVTRRDVELLRLGGAYSDKRERAFRYLQRYACCGQAYAVTSCTARGCNEEIKRSPLRCGNPNVCKQCAESAQYKVQGTRQAYYQKLWGEQLAAITLWLDRPRGQDSDIVHWEWLERTIGELMPAISKARRRCEDPAIAQLGGELWDEDDVAPYRPCVVVLCSTRDAAALLEALPAELGISDHVEIVSPDEAHELMGAAMCTLPYLPRNQAQKWAQIVCLFGKRLARCYKGAQAIEHWSHDELRELRIALGLEQPSQPEEPCRCPKCGASEDHFRLDVVLPTGQVVSWERGGLASQRLTQQVLMAVRRVRAGPC